MNRKELGYVRVAAAIPEVKVADVERNVKEIKRLILEAEKQKVDVIVFPELCVTGYTCQDLFHQEALLKASEKGVEEIVEYTSNLRDLIVIIGALKKGDDFTYNSAYIIKAGEILGLVNKTYLPNYKEFYEDRWFKTPRNKNEFKVFDSDYFNFGVEICEDVWAPIPPSSIMAIDGADIIFNLSATNEVIGKHQYLVNLLKQQSARCICGYVYASSGYGESTQDLIFAGNGIILENGKILEKSERFKKEAQMVVQDIDIESLRNERRTNMTFQKAKENDYKQFTEHIDFNLAPRTSDQNTLRTYNAHPFVPAEISERGDDILKAQVEGLAKRLEHIGAKAVLGVSGGSDSTWALIICVEAMKFLGRPLTDIIGVTMPGFATSTRTYENSKKLMEAFGITQKEADIKEMCRAEMRAMGRREFIQDITFENIQARSRTALLMNIANQEGGIVIGTGDLSELALGWCTYNADHMSMYGVNVDIPKTLIKKLIEWYADEDVMYRDDIEFTGDKVSNSLKIDKVLRDILETPVSPELTGSGATGSKAQVTEDNIGPYELHDFFLYNMLRHGFDPAKILYIAQRAEFDKEYTAEEIKKWLKVFINRFFGQQFKRSCLPDGPKIGSISLSPRGDWRMPSDSVKDVWLKMLD